MEHSEELTEHIKKLNRLLERQRSLWYIFRNGVLYGAGFIIGSTVLTALAVSVTLHFLGGTLFGDVITWLANRGR